MLLAARFVAIVCLQNVYLAIDRQSVQRVETNRESRRQQQQRSISPSSVSPSLLLGDNRHFDSVSQDIIELQSTV